MRIPRSYRKDKETFFVTSRKCGVFWVTRPFWVPLGVLQLYRFFTHNFYIYTTASLVVLKRDVALKKLPLFGYE